MFPLPAGAAGKIATCDELAAKWSRGRVHNPALQSKRFKSLKVMLGGPYKRKRLL
jgi:hypothetical protein